MLEALSPADRAQVSPNWEARIYSGQADHWTLGYRMVRISDGATVGQCGFKSTPSDGVVEMAYGVMPECEGRGYATEAAQLMFELALMDDEVQTVIAHTMERTNASSRVLTKAGFVCVGQVIDPEDGPVFRWERSRKSL